MPSILAVQALLFPAPFLVCQRNRLPYFFPGVLLLRLGSNCNANGDFDGYSAGHRYPFMKDVEIKGDRS